MKNQYIHSPRLSREQVQLVLENAPPEQTILIEGDNGIGKTSLMNQVAEKLSDGGRKLNVVFLNGKTMKDGDLAIPVLNKQTGTLDMVLRTRLYNMLVKEAGILIIDELPKAPLVVQKEGSSIAFERYIGEEKMHPESRVWMTGNLSDEGFGDALDGTFLSRITRIHMGKASGKQIAEYGATQGWHETILLMCNEYSDKIGESYTDLDDMDIDNLDKRVAHNPYIYDPKVESSKDGFVNARTLERASVWMHQYKVNGDAITYNLVRGACGTPFANELFQMLKTSNELPSWDAVESDPSTVQVPVNGVPMIMMVYRCLNNINGSNFKQVMTYIERLAIECQDMFFKLLRLKSKASRDALKVYNALVTLPTFQQWCAKNDFLATPDKKEND